MKLLITAALLLMLCGAALADSTATSPDTSRPAGGAVRYHLLPPLVFNARELAKPCGAIKDVFGHKVSTIWDGPLVPPSMDTRWEEMHLPPDILWMITSSDPARDRHGFLPPHPRR
jgi:hypothetical protein